MPRCTPRTHSLLALFALIALLALISPLLAACGGQTPLAGDEPVTQTTGRPQLPIVFHLAADVPEFFGPHNDSSRKAIKAAMRVWNLTSGYELFQLTDSYHPSVATFFQPQTHLRDGQNVIYVYEGKQASQFSALVRHDDDVLGICFSHAYGSDIALTLELPIPATLTPRRPPASSPSQPHGPQPLTPQPASTGLRQDVLMASDLVLYPNTERTFDLQSVLVHELGHALGFSHDKISQESVMWFDGLDIQGVNRRLSGTDKRNLKELLREKYALAISLNELDDPETRR